MTEADGEAIPWKVNIDQKVNDWVEAIVVRNADNAGPWTARFVIAGYWPTVGAVEDLAELGGSIFADGHDQYVVTFPAEKVREAAQLVAEQGGWLCERQTVVPAPG